MLTLQVLSSVHQGAQPPQRWLSELAEHLTLPRETALHEAATLLGYPVMPSVAVETLSPSFERANYAEMVERLLLVGTGTDGRLSAVLGRPLDGSNGAWLARLPLDELYLGDPEVIRAKLESHEAGFSAVADAVGVEESEELSRDASSDLTLTSIQGEASPAVKLINSTVFDALRYEASDIHLESLPQGMVIKFRIDGVLNKIATVNNPALAEQAIARIKVLAELDIGEKRVPQDGRFRVAAKGRDIDIRVSIMPSIHGEDAVLRVLDKKALIDSVQRLHWPELCLPDSGYRTHQGRDVQHAVAYGEGVCRMVW